MALSSPDRARVTAARQLCSGTGEPDHNIAPELVMATTCLDALPYGAHGDTPGGRLLPQTGANSMDPLVILLILLFVFGVGAGPWWGWSWGYGPSGVLGLVFTILLIVILFRVLSGRRTF